MPMNTAYYVISNGIHIRCENDLIYVDVGHFVDLPQNANQFFESQFFFVAKNVEWESVALD